MAASCPKCGTPRDDARPACPRCGLATARMDAFAAARDDDLPDALAAAWERALAGWDDAARHDEVLRLVGQHDAYAWAAARYRDAARTRADGAATAERQLERVRRAAEATLRATGTPRATAPPAPYRATTAILALLVIIAIAGFVYAMTRRGDGGAPLTPPTSSTK